MLRSSFVAVVVSAAGCLQSNVVPCEDGSICPSGLTCASIALDDGGHMPSCLNADDRCDGDGTPCGDGGACHSGACIPVRCGNLLVDPGEVCDDGNTLADDMCSADCTSTEICGDGVVDPAQFEECDDGRADGKSHDGCSSQCTIEAPTATPFPAQFIRPRVYGGFAYDSARGRTVLFGGVAITGGNPLGDLAEWDGARWHATAPPTGPSPRSGFGMAYDETRETTVVFGGTFEGDQTWTWDGATWQLAHTTTNPPTLTGFGFSYDEQRHGLVVFGGNDVTNPNTPALRGETWFWDGDWHQEQPAMSPPARWAVGQAYDSKRGVTVVFGGSTATTGAMTTAEVWEYDGTTWRRASTGGGPGKRTNAAVAYDPVNQKVIVVGGIDNDSGNPLHDAFAWDGTSWTSLPPPPPLLAAMSGPPQAATDRVRGRVVIHDADGTLIEFDGTQWLRPEFGNQLGEPTPRAYAASATNPDDGELLVFGGVANAFDPNGTNTAKSDTWKWSGSWNSVQTPGPSARWGAAMTYDPTNHEYVMFGGCNASTAFNETWVFHTHPDSWTKRTVSPPLPPKRCDASISYDEVHHQVVMFGGAIVTNPNTGSTTPVHLQPSLDDTWIWDGALQTWTQVATGASDHPEARHGAAVAADAGGRVVLFGGTEIDENTSRVTDYGDLWSWDGAVWSRIPIASPGFSPPARADAMFALDRASAQLVLVGGLRDILNFYPDSTHVLADRWAWDGSAWNLDPIEHLDLVGGRGAGVMVTNPITAGVALFGGFFAQALGIGKERNDVQLIRWDSITPKPDETCTLGTDADDDGLQGCTDPDCSATCAP